MIKQLLYSVIAKYRDLSVSRRSIICLSLRLWQIIDLLATDKSRCFVQPSSNNCQLPITNPSLLILAIIAPVSGYGTDDIEKAKCGYATCLCDMEMIRCFKHYKEDLNLDKYHGWEVLQKKSCAFKGNIFFVIKGFLY